MIAHEGVMPWLLVDDDGTMVEPVTQFLTDFIAHSSSPGCGTQLHLRSAEVVAWLRVLDVGWQRATPVEERSRVVAELRT